MTWGVQKDQSARRRREVSDGGVEGLAALRHRALEKDTKLLTGGLWLV